MGVRGSGFGVRGWGVGVRGWAVRGYVSGFQVSRFAFRDHG